MVHFQIPPPPSRSPPFWFRCPRSCNKAAWTVSVTDCYREWHAVIKTCLMIWYMACWQSESDHLTFMGSYGFSTKPKILLHSKKRKIRLPVFLHENSVLLLLQILPKFFDQIIIIFFFFIFQVNYFFLYNLVTEKKQTKNIKFSYSQKSRISFKLSNLFI
jgi:hypothetical protein